MGQTQEEWGVLGPIQDIAGFEFVSAKGATI